MEIYFSNGYVLRNPEERIREYCTIEIYQGYDDRHNITDEISWADIKATDRLYANIMRFWRRAGEAMVKSPEIPVLLRRMKNSDLDGIVDAEWLSVKSEFRETLQSFLNIHGVGLAVATKVLHLKRPKLIPIFDSYVMNFLLGVDTNSISKPALLEYGVKAFEMSRKDLTRNKQSFDLLQNRLHDLSIHIEKVRLYDILCWTIEKWDIRKELAAPYGKPDRSLQSKAPSISPSSARTPMESTVAGLSRNAQATTCKDAIKEALLHLGGEGTTAQVEAYIRSRYGSAWKDAATTMADLAFPGSMSSTYPISHRFLERVSRGRYRLRKKS